jgi:hypothetical protein
MCDMSKKINVQVAVMFGLDVRRRRSVNKRPRRCHAFEPSFDEIADNCLYHFVGATVASPRHWGSFLEDQGFGASNSRRMHQ